MSNRWGVLALLFCIRVTMAFQFQTVAALSPFFMTTLGIGLADIGLLIGVYLLPGIFIALPGAAIGKRFGDKQTVAFGTVLMLLGGIVVSLLPSWEAQVTGRILAGVGGVILNVLMSKIVTDWFPGQKLSTAMGIFVNSWPVGIAAGLLVLPVIAENYGLQAALWVTNGLIAIGLALLIVLYQSPANAAAMPSTKALRLRGSALICVLLAGSIWGLYNSALGMVFGFGPAMLVERGWSAALASSTISIVLWAVAISIPIGGLIADRLQRRDMVLVIGLVAFAVLMLFAPNSEQTVLVYALLGFAAGLAAGPIMSLPAEVLGPDTRAFGIGLYWMIYYVAFVISPVVAGRLAEWTGAADVVFSFGAAMLCACVLLLWLFKVFAQHTRRAAAE